MSSSESHQGHFLARRRSSRSLYSGNGWRSSLPRNLCIHHLLRLGDHSCAQHWFRLLDERADCRGSSACSRASPGWIWRCCKSCFGTFTTDQLVDPFRRSSPSSAPFTGVWSSLVTVDTKATSVMLLVSGPPQSHGPPSSSPLNTL